MPLWSLTNKHKLGLCRRFIEQVHANQTVIQHHISHSYHLSLSVHDNGRGLGTAPLRGQASLGLLGMRERLRQMGGVFSIQGNPRDGTT
ncbi:MAG TPA: hypothetical protein VIY29_17300, partial [Ktedonobacteraceae bacterium]